RHGLPHQFRTALLDLRGSLLSVQIETAVLAANPEGAGCVFTSTTTGGENTLDLVYTNIKDAVKAAPHPHLSSSDHLSVMLIPAYRPLLIRAKPTV
ncbi:unnamed protein product, partial [Menidia menidia]